MIDTPAPPPVADDPGWTSSDKEHKRKFKPPRPPRPPEAPGYSTMQKDRQPSKTPHVKSWPPPERTRAIEMGERRVYVRKELLRLLCDTPLDNCIRCSGTGYRPRGVYYSDECDLCQGTGYADAYMVLGFKPPPAPDLPTRDSSRKTKREDRQPSLTPYTRGVGLFGIGTISCPDWLLRFIDWLNALLGAEKSKGKRKETDEQMVSLAELFEDVKNVKEKPPGSYGTYQQE